MRVLVSLGMLALLLLPLVPAQGASSLMATTAGVGTFGHDSASGHEVCPYSPVAVTMQPAGPTLVLRAGGAADPTTMPPTKADDYAYMCALGVTVTFDQFTGSPETGYHAYRQTDYGTLAGVTTEELFVSPMSGSTVHVDYAASTVGGPAPSSWYVHGVMVRAFYA